MLKENNRVVVINANSEITCSEIFSDANSAYKFYIESIELIKKNVQKGEKWTVVRFRWNSIMAMETVEG